MKYQTLNMLLPQLPVEMINQTLKELISDNNLLIPQRSHRQAM